MREDNWHHLENERRRVSAGLKPCSSMIPPIDCSHLEECYEFDVSLRRKFVEVDINFDQSTIDPEFLTPIEMFLIQLEAFHEKAIGAILHDFAQGGECTREYFDHHLLALSKSQLKGLFRTQKPQNITFELFASKMSLVRVGFYPEENAGPRFAVFDYTIGRRLTDYVLAFGFDRQGERTWITMES